MSYSQYKLFFKIKGEIYYAGSIRTNHNKMELFYQYPFGSRTKSKVINADMTLSEGYLPDHISFHNDGNIHSKAKDGSKKVIYHNQTSAGKNIFNLDRANYLPFFIESINISEPNLMKYRFNPNESFDPQKDILYDVSHLNSFSILLISKCERMNPFLMFNNENLQNIQVVGSPIIQEIFTVDNKKKMSGNHSSFSSELVICVIENIWKEFPPIELNKESGNCLSISVCLPAIQDFKLIINRNRNKF